MRVMHPLLRLARVAKKRCRLAESNGSNQQMVESNKLLVESDKLLQRQPRTAAVEKNREGRGELISLWREDYGENRKISK